MYYYKKRSYEWMKDSGLKLPVKHYYDQLPERLRDIFIKINCVPRNVVGVSAIVLGIELNENYKLINKEEVIFWGSWENTDKAYKRCSEWIRQYYSLEEYCEKSEGQKALERVLEKFNVQINQVLMSEVEKEKILIGK